MSDPRQEERLRAQSRQASYLPTQVIERIRQKLSPVDDELPFAQAVRQRDDLAQAAKAFSKRQKGREK